MFQYRPLAAKNSNIEIRNSKQLQNTNAPMSKTERRLGVKFWSFEFGTLDIVSDFVLRISDFQLLRKSQRNLDLRFYAFSVTKRGKRGPFGATGNILIGYVYACQL
jgi:hypothetical protein